MRKTILFAVAALMLTACSNDEPIVAPTDESGGMRANPYRVSLDDALENADCLLAQISDSELTRSGKQRRVASIKYIGAPGTHSADTDTMLYLVNYEDNGGFALLSADSRLRPIYAISDEGSLAIEDTAYNKGLATFVRGVEAEVAGIVIGPVERDTTVIIDDQLYRDTVITKKKVGPLLTNCVKDWSQHSPYNNYCPYFNGKRSLVGCVAIAVGQIMAYHKWPESYDGLTLNWDAINNGTNNYTLAKFLCSLGKAENLNMLYTDTASYAYYNRCDKTFQNLGYTTNSSVSFSETDICSYLEGNYNSQYVASPVIITSSHRISGHAWVIDGYMQYHYTIYVGTTVFTYDDPVLYHCVWGWGGRNNGYYYHSYNDLDGDDIDDGRYGFTPDIIEKDEVDTSTKDPYNFEEYYNCNYMAGFIPQK